MSGITSIVISLCAAAIIGSAVYMLSPKGAMSRVIKTVVGVFMLGCLIVPLSGLDIDTELPQKGVSEASEISSRLNNTVNRQSESVIVNEIHKYLLSEGARVIDIEIHRDDTEISAVALVESSSETPFLSEKATGYFGFKVEIETGE